MTRIQCSSTDANPLATQAGMFRGWRVVAGAFGVTLVGFGSAYTFSVFVAPLQQAFGASRGAASLVFSLAGFLYFGLGVLSGPLADRFGARRLALAGLLLVGLGLALAGLAQRLEQVYLAYGLGVGLGVGLAYVPVLGAVQRWFTRRRGLASGLAVSGIGVGTLLLPPLAALLVERLGWRGAYLSLGVLALVLGLAAAWLVEDDPRRHGLGPDGDPPNAGAAARAAQGATVCEALRAPAFWRLYAACLLCSFSVFLPFVHLVPYAEAHGVPLASAVLLLGLIGIGSTAGRFLLGGLLDRIGRGRALLALFAGMALALAGWALASGFWALAAFALVYGTVYGAWVAVLPAVVMDHFGGRSVSGIIGALYTSVAVGTLAGPTAAGFAFDLRHSYQWPIWLGVALNVLAVGVMLRQSSPAGARA